MAVKVVNNWMLCVEGFITSVSDVLIGLVSSLTQVDICKKCIMKNE